MCFHDVLFMRFFGSANFDSGAGGPTLAIRSLVLPTAIKTTLIRVLQELLPNAEEPRVSAGICIIWRTGVPNFRCRLIARLAVININVKPSPSKRSKRVDSKWHASTGKVREPNHSHSSSYLLFTMPAESG